MNNLIRMTLLSLGIALILVTRTAYADHEQHSPDTADLLLGIAADFLAGDALSHAALDRPNRRDQRRDYRQGREFSGRHSDRQQYGGASYTSEPIRGGSSRRTRIIENPYPNRPVTGVSFTGIEHDAVHINDVITYPRERLISRAGYSLSLYHPSRFFPTRGYVDYISVKAKRKEYFTVTFHYD